LLCFIVFLRGKIRHYKYGSLAKFFLHPLASLLYLVSLCILFLLSHSFLSFFNLFVSSSNHNCVLTGSYLICVFLESQLCPHKILVVSLQHIDCILIASKSCPSCIILVFICILIVSR
jgi:hypothetical protein